MKPISPVMPGIKLHETVYAKDQLEYQPLPTYKTEDGEVLSRWKLSWKERFVVLLCGDVYLWVSTFNRPLQPIMMQILRPKVE